MAENKDLIVYKENIINKIKKFLKNIFNIKSKEIVLKDVNNANSYIGVTRQKFNEQIAFKEDKEEIQMIDMIKQKPEKLKQMNSEELDKIKKAIINRQKFVDKRIEKLKTDLVMVKKM